MAVQTDSCLAWQRTRRLVFFLDGTYILPSYSISIDVHLRKDNLSNQYSCYTMFLLNANNVGTHQPVTLNS